MSVIPEFSRDEYETRWRRARALMAGPGLDALLVTSEANDRYLAGHHRAFWLSKARQMMLLLPRERAGDDRARGAPGMVLTIEPTLAAEHGLYQLEEIYVVTAPGPELLTAPASPELRVVP
ncbi:MAG: aminopeptidase P family N-terminal domain-containing protein [Candidatus Rokuibacteriota bacterium]